VNPNRLLSRFIAMLCALALCSAMAGGWSRGFLCERNGEKQWTPQGHCHSTFGAECESDAGKHGRDADGARRDHTPLGAEVKGRALEGEIAWVSAPALLAVLSSIECGWCVESQVRRGLPRVLDGSPPVSVAVVRSVVLRI
jgi:hypothetical protein